MKIGMISLGCPKNLVDSEVMLGLAQAEGHDLTRDAAEADLIIVNTCAFIDNAKQESIDAILEMAEYKKTGACRRLVVTGCMAERYRDELRAHIPEIDVVLGTGEVPRIVDALGARDPGLGTRDPGSGSRMLPLLRATGVPVTLESRVPGPEPRVPSPGPRAPSPESRIPSPEPRVPSPESRIPSPGSRPTYLYDADTPRLLATPRHYAYLKIAEGCDYACSFCIIPTLRGSYRSRSHASVVNEARRLASTGVKELLLVSQDTSFYGNDRGERGALSRLLVALTDIRGLEWIRLLYLYPTTIGDDVLDVMAGSEKICKYVDLPLQHASDTVLKRMRRPGTRAGYERLLDRIRRTVPGVALRTTFIVGFPGETSADVEQLLSFVRAAEFDHVGVFLYSHEEGTSAHGLGDDVPPSVKRRRQAAVMREQKRIVERAHRARIGTRAAVLVDGPTAEHDLVLRGRLQSQAPEIDPFVYLTDCDPSGVVAGQFVEVEIVAGRSYDLVARPLSGSDPA